MPRCVFTSPGLPSGFPGENFTDKTLGGRASSIRSLLNVVHTVGIPASSTPRATSPTDWLQMTQVGVRNAMSTLSSLSRSPTFFEFSSSGPVT
jgi:hypothetical protein